MSRMLVLALPLALLACTGGGEEDPTDGTDDHQDKTGLSEGPSCEATETELSLDEETDLGFAAQALVDLAEGAHDVTLSWAGGTEGTMTLTATLDGRALFVDEEAVYPTGTGDVPSIGVVCDDHVAIEGTLSVATEDGLLDESLEVVFRSVDGTRVDVWAELDPDDLVGTLVFDDFHSETDVDERSMHIGATFDASGTWGEVAGMISGTGDCAEGEPCTAWAGAVDIGTWGQEE